MIKCGHCGGNHQTVQQVRSCSFPGLDEWRDRRDPVVKTITDKLYGPDIEQVEREMHRMEAEADRAESRQDAANKVAKWVAENSLNDLIERVSFLLKTRVEPANEWRWSRAIRQYIAPRNTERVTEFALMNAIARLESYPEIPEVPGRQTIRIRMDGSPEVQHEGLYRMDEKLYQVIRSKGDNPRLYAKLVTFVEGQKRPVLDYAKGVIYDLRPEHLLPAEEAQEITRNTGWCVFNHFLTNPKSIARGMGPTCYARYPHLAKNREAS